MDVEARAELQGRAMRELSIAHQLAETRLNRALRPLGLTMTHTAVLLHLANAGPGSVGDIAAAMEVNQPAVSKTLKTLVDRGAVTVQAAADDARRRDVSLTPLGGELIGQAMRAMHPDATVAFAGLDDTRLRDLVELLGEVRVALDDARRR
ncbi:MarR family transcriptional regulator [Dactylosporangium aurantiacum]|uniref:MarR family transcriptional regulator n=1 Tax=Dactylosporangium aurantiacum TaxID=35754 RepID=A0A9Q9IG52_9ACTN|nr:MarR family transcriptional regulator [Dactylosporangium aurantiacum]MDG6100844.1 MarR family transcriptional regulator [Dactylosporangium aurantiacum]UWZ55096.1 MarR family transcriptional regulator [Dactylosporangium aurantiacum]